MHPHGEAFVQVWTGASGNPALKTLWSLFWPKTSRYAYCNTFKRVFFFPTISLPKFHIYVERIAPLFDTDEFLRVLLFCVNIIHFM